jgi:hypothetical protein
MGTLLGVRRAPTGAGRRPSSELVKAARRFFRGRDVVIEPRKLWVTGLAGVRNSRLHDAGTLWRPFDVVAHAPTVGDHEARRGTVTGK